MAFACNALPALAGAAPPRPAAPAANAAPRAGNAQLGQQKSEAERCQECHGADGQGNSAEAKFARLAGLPAEYLFKQLRDFRSGQRQQDVMQVMARSVEEDDLRDIAAYFASLPPMRSPAPTAAAAEAVALFHQGDPARGIAACASCHGEAGRGLPGPQGAPALAGQDTRYLLRQLHAWRNGERRNDPSGAMNRNTAALTDAEIGALSAYLGGL